jgi:hypothetical protein
MTCELSAIDANGPSGRHAPFPAIAAARVPDPPFCVA